jgi:ABC-type multidrug transport system fused ATPase/permease subunit
MEKTKKSVESGGKRMKQILFFMRQLHRLQGTVIYTNQIGMALMGLIDGIGIFLLIPLINLTGIFQFSERTSFKIPLITYLFHFFSPTENLVLILCLYVVLMIGQNLFQKHQMVLNSKLQQQFIRKLKVEMYQAILHSDWNFFIRKRKSDLTNLMLVEVSRVGAGTNSFLQFVSSLIFTLVQVGIAFYISIKMTLFVIIFGALLLVFSRTFIRRTHSLGKETVELSRTYLGGVTDQLNGIKDIKSNLLEASYLNWFRSISLKIETNLVELTRIRMSSQLVYKSASSILIAVFLFLSIQLFKAQPTQLMLVILIFSRLWPKLTSIQSNLEQLSANIPSFNVLIDFQKECKEAKEIKSEVGVENTEPLQLQHGLECRNVFFSYETAKGEYALENINLMIPANHMTAVVGKSGAGKSTLIDLLMGLNRPQMGEVWVDNEPINDMKLIALRQSISYVPQEPFIFNSSVRDNLLVVKPDASDEELWEALQFAAAAEFVHKLPHKLQTLIGDRGIKLSGGERQRLVLARAILKKPSVLILDEATSSLDTENEVKIQEALERIQGKMTLIVIAHRLSTIRNADQVVVLDKGRVAQIGRYKQLASDKRGVFNHLLSLQLEVSTQ